MNWKRGIALLSQEGSGIAKRIPRGVVPSTKCFGFGTTPALRATPKSLDGCAKSLKVSRCRAHASRGLAFAAAHVSYGSAKTYTDSLFAGLGLVMAPPPEAVTATYCFPFLPRYVMGTEIAL